MLNFKNKIKKIFNLCIDFFLLIGNNFFLVESYLIRFYPPWIDLINPYSMWNVSNSNLIWTKLNPIFLPNLIWFEYILDQIGLGYRFGLILDEFLSNPTNPKTDQVDLNLILANPTFKFNFTFHYKKKMEKSN